MITKSFLSKTFTKGEHVNFIKSVTGEQSQLSLIKLEPGQILSNERPNEQIGIILKGKAELKILDRIYELQSGDSYVIPMFAEHSFSVVGREVLEYIQVFAPPLGDDIL